MDKPHIKFTMVDGFNPDDIEAGAGKGAVQIETRGMPPEIIAQTLVNGGLTLLRRVQEDHLQDCGESDCFLDKYLADVIAVLEPIEKARLENAQQMINSHKYNQ